MLHHYTATALITPYLGLSDKTQNKCYYSPVSVVSRFGPYTHFYIAKVIICHELSSLLMVTGKFASRPAHCTFVPRSMPQN